MQNLYKIGNLTFKNFLLPVSWNFYAKVCFCTELWVYTIFFYQTDSENGYNTYFLMGI
jgi:hypothetical protein